MIAHALVGAGPPAYPQRLNHIEQPQLVQPGEALPVGRRFRRRLHPIGGTAQGEEGGKLPMQPAGEVPHRGVDAHQGGLRQPLLLQRFLKKALVTETNHSSGWLCL